MKHLFVVALSILSLMSCTVNIVHRPPEATNQKTEKHDISRSVVILSAEPREGEGLVIVATGFAIDKNRIATAAHFCIDAVKLKVFSNYTINATKYFPNGNIKILEDLTLDKMSEQSDVCLLESPNHLLPPLKLSHSYEYDVKVGDDVMIVGSPAGTVVGEFHGKVMSVHYTGRGPDVLKGKLVVSAPATGGISGSPIVSQKTGEVIGILVMGHPTFDHLSFGVPIPELIELIE